MTEVEMLQRDLKRSIAIRRQLESLKRQIDQRRAKIVELTDEAKTIGKRWADIDVVES